MTSKTGGRRCAIGVAAASLQLISCTSNGPATTPATTEPAATTVTPSVVDGVLRIGVLMPASGAGASIGQSARAGIRVAVNLVNAAGGVNGAPVQLFIRDEGSDAVTAAVSLQQLIDAKVDAIIGPASSNTAVALAPTIVAAGVAACSPSASALALDDFPDNHLLFRTIASDSLQAEAMAKVIEQTGETRAAIVYVDDGYGRPFEQHLTAALQRRGIAVSDSVGFAISDNDFATDASRLVNPDNGAIAIIGDPDAGSRMLAALAEAIGSSPREIVVNDALRRPWSISLLGSVNAQLRRRVVGVSPSVRTEDPVLLAAVAAEDPTATGLFATQAYDCANLFMLAAQQGGSSEADVIASLMVGVSTGGSACATFADCRSLLDAGRNINYDGPGGLVDLGASGDPEVAQFDQFSFDDGGRDVTTNTITVSYTGA